MAPILLLLSLALLSSPILPISGSSCRSYCGNVTVDYPFSLQPGCGHPGFRDLLFCINANLMLHIPSGSYRVMDIDYAYRSFTLHDHAMSDCYSLSLSSPDPDTTNSKGNGFVVEPWRAAYLAPSPDNVFMLLGCSAGSPLFQGFPARHLPCRNVSGMGCEDYYNCPAWMGLSPRGRESAYGSTSPPECCSVAYGAMRAINLTHLGCRGYSSAYNVAPLRPPGPGAWSYGIRASYTVPVDHDAFCRDCEATGGACGFDAATEGNLCLCKGWNSTSSCDSGSSMASSIKRPSSLSSLIGGFLMYKVASIFCSLVS